MRPPLPPVVEFRGYQQRWIDDKSRAKIMVKSARIGISFATGYEIVEDAIAKSRSTWTVLSAGEAQAVEFVGIARDHLELMHEVAQLYDEPFVDALGEATTNQHRMMLPNQSRIIALACNPRTARGFPGNAVLNEFAHVQDSYAVWAAIMRQIALGHRVAIESTPYRKIGKFYDVAKDLGLAEGVAPSPNPIRKGPWSGHWVDVFAAAAEGCPIDPEEQRELMKDEAAFKQEFLNQFAEPLGAWLTMELIGQCEHEDATIDWPAGYVPKGPLYMGLDIARDHDLTVLWIDELVGDVLWTRAVIALHAMPFFGHSGAMGQVDILEPWVQKATRFAMDATGMGVGMYDWFAHKFGGRVMGVNFGGQNDQGVRMKVDLAMRIKQRFERALDRIPRRNACRNWRRRERLRPRW
ncbi:MAG: hypothetical protein HY046_08365 [Acidobacteria bacterium]|nr:hypothetical protein [Acidobacteriota bacterium]